MKMEENTEEAKPKASHITARSWKDEIGESARALGIDGDTAIALIEIWPSAEDVAHDAFPPGHPSGWHYGDAARAAGGNLYRVDGQPPPDVLAFAVEKRIPIEHVALLGGAYDQFARSADLHNALIDLSGWAKMMASRTDACAADGGANSVLSFEQLLGELDPQIHHTTLTYRAAGLLADMLSGVFAAVHRFGEDCRISILARSSARRTIMERAMREHVLGRGGSSPSRAPTGSASSRTEGCASSGDIGSPGF
jgi:hypothetical protein